MCNGVFNRKRTERQFDLLGQHDPAGRAWALLSRPDPEAAADDRVTTTVFLTAMHGRPIHRQPARRQKAVCAAGVVSPPDDGIVYDYQA